MKKYLEQNISILPIKAGTKEPALKKWKEYQSKPMTIERYDTLFNANDSVAMIGGKVSDNLICLDFDNKLDNADEVMSNFQAIDGVTEIIIDNDLPIQQTPSGGWHIIYKCQEPIGRSEKLARQLNPKTNKPEVLIETRGEGGYFLVYPSSGYMPIKDDLGIIPTITKENHELLISASKSLNVYYEPSRENKGNIREYSEITSGDDYNQSPEAIGDSVRLLKGLGWFSSNGKHWVRPNKPKKNGISATFGIVGKGIFYVFSTNAFPFESNTGYSPFAVRAVIRHSGDYSACAKELANVGFGFKGIIKRKTDEARGRGYNLSPNEIIDIAIDTHSSEELVKKEIANVDTAVDTPKKKDKPKKLTLIDVEKYIDSKFDVRMNTVLNLLEFKFKTEDKFRDMNVFDIMRQASYDGFEISETMANAILSSTSIREEYNPFQDTYDKLPVWDGKDHVKKLCTYFTLSDPRKMEFFESMILKSMLRTIKCSLDDMYYNRMVLALISPKQEIGKSYFIRWINPAPVEYYNDTPISDSKDALISYTNSLIYNIEELDNTSKAGLGAIKGIISTQSVNVRLPYAKQQVRMPRRCTFWATTNEKDFLEEKTNSRWLCFDIEDINQKYSVQVDKKQLWAQIYHYYTDGSNMELTNKEKVLRDEINTVYVEETTEQAVCRNIFIKSDDEWLSNAKIYDAISEYSPIKYPNSRRVGRAMNILGFEQKSVNNVRGWKISINNLIRPI